MIQVSGILLIQDGMYVAQRRDNIPTISEPGKLAPWGGHIEGDETPLQAAVRELKEETGVTVDESDVHELCAYDTSGRAPHNLGQPVRVYLYATEIPSDVVVECFEGERLERVTEAHEPDASDFLVKAIEEYEQQQSQSA